MPITQIPPLGDLQDGQFFEVEGPNGITTGFFYDEQQRALYFRESQVIFPSHHGFTHVTSDPIPVATTDLMGLMSADDKVKLDSILQTRIGVLGFMGAGHPDDGGWMTGDLIFAAGTEFISLERIGNVVRFTVDSPTPLACSCESCTSIYWIQDETSIQSIRPPTCAGKMPDVTGYGELKFYLFPESTIFDPNNPAAKLNLKGQYPSLTFVRYNNGIAPGTAEFDLVLQRDNINTLQSVVGWSMTPGPTGVTECVWFTGKDSSGNQLRFDLKADNTPGMLGALLCNGNLITKKPAVITGYTSSTLTNNQYICRWWNTNLQKAIGATFPASNVWQYNNVGSTSSSAPQQLLLDVSIDLLPIGTLVDITYFQLGQVASTTLYRYYFYKRPELSAQNIWTQVGSISFGDTLTARSDLKQTLSVADSTTSVLVASNRTFEHTAWGLTGFDEPLLDFTNVNLSDTSGSALNQAHRAVFDTNLPGMRIMADPDLHGNYLTRPVVLWNRNDINNSKLTLLVGRPAPVLDQSFPIDILFNAPIDSYDNVYMRVASSGVLQGFQHVLVKGAYFHDLPASGTIRILTRGTNINKTYRYSRKLIFPGATDDNVDKIALIADYTTNLAYPGASGDIVELLHEDYNSACVRIEFQPGFDVANSVSMQFKVGTLDMGTRYENEVIDSNELEDYVRGLAAGYTVSPVYTQSGSFTGVGVQPPAVPVGFVCYNGGAQTGGTQTEYWNKLEIMQKEGQIWIWWNGLLIAPSSQLSALLPFPVTISTPYFPITHNRTFGKVGVRLWPGATMRSMQLLTNSTAFNEFAYGQLNIGSI